MVIRAFGAAPIRYRVEILLGAMPPLLVHRNQRLTYISSGEAAAAVPRFCLSKPGCQCPLLAAISTGRCNTLFESVCWCFKLQCLSGPFV